MKKKNMLEEKKKYKRNQRQLKKIKRNIESRLKFLKMHNNIHALFDIDYINFVNSIYNEVYKSDFMHWQSGLPGCDTPITVKFDTPREVKRRCPNEKEIINERISILRRLYSSGKMCRNAYYTLKGLARKDPINAENFIRKHDKLDYECLQLFKTTESILEMSVPWKSDVITSEIYTINLNLKEEN